MAKTFVQQIRPVGLCQPLRLCVSKYDDHGLLPSCVFVCVCVCVKVSE